MCILIIFNYGFHEIHVIRLVLIALTVRRRSVNTRHENMLSGSELVTLLHFLLKLRPLIDLY